jgi:tetratricopeptide (TPR) repeat protein
MPKKPLETDRKNPGVHGYALGILMSTHGWTQGRLAEAAGVSGTMIWSYLWNEDKLTRERLDELALRFMGLAPEDVQCALLAARIVLPPRPVPSSPVDPPAADLRTHRLAAAISATEVFEIALEDLLRTDRRERQQQALAQGREAADRLKTYARSDQLVLLKGAPEFQHWSVAFTLCADSEAAAPHKPPRALELAELALLAARHVEGVGEGFRNSLLGWCHGFVGNARRVIGSSLPAALQSFEEARRLWDLGEDPAGLLSEAHLLDMEASLRRALRQFDRALELHEDALLVALLEEVGSILLNKGGTLQQSLKYEQAIETLAKAEAAIDGERQPRLLQSVLFNRATCLCLLQRAEEAVPLVSQVRLLAERLRNDVDLIRALWLEATCDTYLGRKEDAVTKLAKVRLDLREQLPFDHALASLDLASIYRGTGDTQRIKGLASEMLEIFQAQKVHREAIVAILLFREAAEEERVTAELLQKLREYLTRAKAQPELIFEAP